MKEHGAIAHELGRVAQNILAAEGFFYSAAARMDRPDTYGFPWKRKTWRSPVLFRMQSVNSDGMP